MIVAYTGVRGGIAATMSGVYNGKRRETTRTLERRREETAASLGVSGPAFHEHLRPGQRKPIDTYLNPETAERYPGENNGLTRGVSPDTCVTPRTVIKAPTGRFSPTSSTPKARVSAAVVRAVGGGGRPTAGLRPALRPYQALDALFDRSGDAPTAVSLEYEGHAVTVRGRGEVVADAAERGAEPTA